MGMDESRIHLPPGRAFAELASLRSFVRRRIFNLWMGSNEWVSVLRSPPKRWVL